MHYVRDIHASLMIWQFNANRAQSEAGPAGALNENTAKAPRNAKDTKIKGALNLVLRTLLAEKFEGRYEAGAAKDEAQSTKFVCSSCVLGVSWCLGG